MKFIHTADHHIGKNFRHFSEISARLAVENMRILEKLADIAVRDADIWLIAGDLYEYDQISAAEKINIVKIFEQTASKLPILLVAGNHDPFFPGSFYEELASIDGVHVFSPRSAERIDIPELDTSIYGRSFQSLYERASLLPNLLEQADSKLGVPPLENRCLLLHGDVRASKTSSDHNLLLARDLDALPVAYIALGHIHRADPTSSSKWRYAGPPTGHSFKRTGETGYYCGEIINGQLVGLDFHALDTIHFYDLRVDVSTAETQYDIVKLLENAVSEYGSEHVYRLRLAGTVQRSLASDLAEIEAGIRTHLLACELIDETKISYDTSKLLEDKGLRGYFYRQIMARQAEQNNSELLELALAVGLEAIDDQV